MTTIAKKQSRRAFYKAGVELLKQFIKENFPNFHADKVEIYHDQTVDHGIRIVEIAFLTYPVGGGMAGCSWMRDDVGLATPAFFLPCEDFVLRHEEKPWRPEGWESDMDVFEDAKARLRQVLKEIG